MISVRGEVVPRSAGDRQPRPADRRDRDAGDRARRAGGGRDAAVPARRGHGRRRGAAPALPLPRPAPRADAARARAAPPGHRRRCATTSNAARLPRDGDADPDALDAGGRARLRRPEPAAARQLLRAAAVAAALQAAADDRRLRALLPDRALLPRRGPARRPPAGVHAARPRDVVRGRGGRDGGHRRASSAPRSRPAAWSSATPFPRLTYAEAIARYGTDRPDLRFGLEIRDLGDALRDTEFKVFRGVLERRRRRARHQRRRARAVAGGAGPADRVRPGAGRGRPGVGVCRGGRAAGALRSRSSSPSRRSHAIGRRARGLAGRPAAAGRRRGGRRRPGARRAAAGAGASASGSPRRATGARSG